MRTQEPTCPHPEPTRPDPYPDPSDPGRPAEPLGPAGRALLAVLGGAFVLCLLMLMVVGTIVGCRALWGLA